MLVLMDAFTRLLRVTRVYAGCTRLRATPLGVPRRPDPFLTPVPLSSDRLSSSNAGQSETSPP